jgi:putative colanic acid biosynthesis UDP-glucose lipid carrier transferase
MTATDLPLLSFFQRVLDPLIIMGMLYLSSMLLGEPFTGYALVLTVMAFFISSSVYEHVDPYSAWRGGRLFASARNVVIGWIVTAVILVLLASLSGFTAHYSQNVVMVWFIATPVVLVVSHLAARRLMADPERDIDEVRSAVIIGANQASQRFAETVEHHPHLFMSVHGYFDDRSEDRWPADLRQPMLGKVADVCAYVRQHHIRMVFISQPISADPRVVKLLDELQDTTASVYFLPNIYVFDLMQARFDNIGGMPVIAICESPFTGFNAFVKRASDIVLAACISLLLLPVMAVIGMAVKLGSRGPMIFKQRRYGLHGEEIIVYKFRSMTVAEDGDNVVQAKKNDQRITPIGGFLRRSSLDELPQFINVLQGRMSIVGPRPHAVSHNEQYRKLIKGYMLRHKVKPGITGLAQVNGLRGETETLDKMEARVECDLDYLRNWSLWLDIWIILRTVQVVLKRENAH